VTSEQCSNEEKGKDGTEDAGKGNSVLSACLPVCLHGMAWCEKIEFISFLFEFSGL